MCSEKIYFKSKICQHTNEKIVSIKGLIPFTYKVYYQILKTNVQTHTGKRNKHG